MTRFLALLALGAVVILTISLANVPQAGAATNSTVAAFSCDNTGDTVNSGTPVVAGTATAATAAFLASTSCVGSDKILTDAHFTLKALEFTSPNVYELWIKGGGDD